jgi:hypothetical protein
MTSPALVSLDAPIVRQVAVTGRVRDAIDGRGLAAAIALDWRTEPPGGAFRPFPGAVKAAGDGRFAIHCDPATLDPGPSGTVRLRLSVTVPGRAPVVVEATDPASAWALADRSAPTSGGTTRWRGLAGPVRAFDVAVAPNPVALEGHVFRDNDPATPAAGATVTIVAPPTPGAATVGADGAFRIDALPVVETVGLSIVDGPRSAAPTLRVDYAARINRAAFGIET